MRHDPRRDQQAGHGLSVQLPVVVEVDGALRVRVAAVQHLRRAGPHQPRLHHAAHVAEQLLQPEE